MCNQDCRIGSGSKYAPVDVSDIVFFIFFCLGEGEPDAPRRGRTIFNENPRGGHPGGMGGGEGLGGCLNQSGIDFKLDSMDDAQSTRPTSGTTSGTTRSWDLVAHLVLLQKLLSFNRRTLDSRTCQGSDKIPVFSYRAHRYAMGFHGPPPDGFPPLTMGLCALCAHLAP